MAPSAFERDLGKSIRSRLGDETKVVRFGDDDGVNDCFIVSGFNCPIEGVTSYSSIGLSRTTQKLGIADVRVELITACASGTPHVDNLMASCVFECFRNGTNISYGSLITNIVSQYRISDTLRHVTFVSPFLWHGFNRLEVGAQDIHFLLMLPISESEKIFAENNGIDALENVFNKAQIDIYDVHRSSIIS